MKEEIARCARMFFWQGQFKVRSRSRQHRLSLLRKRHAAPLEERAEQVLGEQAHDLLAELKDVLCESREDFEATARKFLRYCAPIKKLVGRQRYFATCISNHRRILQLRAWQKDNPDFTDFLTCEELREIDRAEIDEYYKERDAVELELAALQGGQVGLALLIERIGREKAWAAMLRLMDVIDATNERGLRRVHSIMARAAASTKKYPVRYIDAVVENEEAEIRAARKSRRR